MVVFYMCDILYQLDIKLKSCYEIQENRYEIQKNRYEMSKKIDIESRKEYTNIAGHNMLRCILV